jgi:hypothetical protein
VQSVSNVLRREVVSVVGITAPNIDRRYNTIRVIKLTQMIMLLLL